MAKRSTDLEVTTVTTIPSISPLKCPTGDCLELAFQILVGRHRRVPGFIGPRCADSASVLPPHCAERCDPVSFVARGYRLLPAARHASPGPHAPVLGT